MSGSIDLPVRECNFTPITLPYGGGENVMAGGELIGIDLGLDLCRFAWMSTSISDELVALMYLLS